MVEKTKNSSSIVSSFGYLLAIRYFLGVAEAGFSRGVVMYLCYWYKPSERATRLASLAGSIVVAGKFSALKALEGIHRVV